MGELRLGDIIDDYCIKCKRLTNHAIVSIVDSEVAKVRCRSCYHDHTYLREIAPPTKKDLAKAALFNAVLAGVEPGSASAHSDPDLLQEAMESESMDALPELENEEAVVTAEAVPDPPKKARGRAAKKAAE